MSRSFWVFLCVLVGGTGTLAQEAPTVVRLEENLEYGELLVIGEVEQVTLPEYNVTWPARIDTGATTTSIYATDIEEYERDGDQWVRYQIRNDDKDESVPAERPVARIAQIQRRGTDEMQRRPVVLMDVQMGDTAHRIEVNLTDRKNFEFAILIGRNFLEGTAVVDVSRKNVQPVAGSGDGEKN